MRRAVFRLFTHHDPFDLSGTDPLFLEALRENVSFHAAHCPPYQSILRQQGFAPDQLTSPDALHLLPCLPTALFKHHRLFSMPESRIPVKATSSGTNGLFSRIGLDWQSLYLGARMVLRVAHWRGLLSLRPTNYIILGYEPHRSNEMAVMKTAFGATLFAPAVHRSYALRFREGKYDVDLNAVMKDVQTYARSRFPVRFMGFPSYTYFLLREMDARGIRVTLPKHSKIMLGGGWKQFAAQQVDKQTLYDLIRRVLGVEEQNIIEFFGAVEHPILWCDCPAHHFHVPVYARVMIRDVRTLEPVRNGEQGLVNLLTPMIRACPLSSIMTDDIGILHEESCSCGLHTPWLELCGRSGLRDIKTCAAGAAELLGEVRL